MEGDD